MRTAAQPHRSPPDLLIYGNGSALKDSHPTLFSDTMSRDLALSLLRAGSNGDEILMILDTIAADESDDESDEIPSEILEFAQWEDDQLVSA